MQPFPSTCEVTVHLVASLMAYSHGYTEHLWTNSTKALHVTLTGPSCFCTSRQGNNFHWHSHPRVYSFQILILSTSTRTQAQGLQGTYPLRMFFLLDPLTLCFTNSKRLGDYTQWVYFPKKCTSPGGFIDYLVASLTKALRLHLFLLGKTRRNKKASEFNHDTFEGLMDQGPRGSPWEFYLDGPYDGPRSVEGHETRWRGLQAILDQLSRLTMKARFCNRTRTLLL